MKLGILQIDLDLAIYSGFLIIGLLYYYAWRIIMYADIWSSITQPRHQQYYSYYTATTSAVLFLLHSHDISSIIRTWEPYL